MIDYADKSWLHGTGFWGKVARAFAFANENHSHLRRRETTPKFRARKRADGLTYVEPIPETELNP
jgi:hypothetical protein